MDCSLGESVHTMRCGLWLVPVCGRKLPLTLPHSHKRSARHGGVAVAGTRASTAAATIAGLERVVSMGAETKI